MEKATWNNTRLVKGDIAAEVRKMKEEDGPGMVLMGSGSIVSQLSTENVIDEYQLVVFPLVLGQGRSMFEGARRRLGMKLLRARTFTRSGIELLCYAPA
jgi:dihydrofolate reductase